ncbi:unnamed protein product [Dicrocoelium dendriticum]|nr:unnamed protein product [Dicrocoelium dendriticum]
MSHWSWYSVLPKANPRCGFSLLMGAAFAFVILMKAPAIKFLQPCRGTFKVQVSAVNPTALKLEISGGPSVSIDWTKQKYLKDRIRILCYINTIPRTNATKAIHVKFTWADQCTKYLFMSSADDPTLPSVNLHLKQPEGRKHLWSKMRIILNYVSQFADDYDFFLKADDDTFVIMENLRAALRLFNPEQLLMFGYPFKHIIPQGHLSGGAGYVISRGLLKELVNNVIDKHPACPTYDEDMEDVKISMCAYAIGARLEHLVDRHSTFPFAWRSEPQNEYLFQWRSLTHLFSQIISKSDVVLPPPFNPKDPFVREEAVSHFLLVRRSNFSLPLSTSAKNVL